LNSSINWHSLVFESGWLEKCDRLAIKRFGPGGLAEEASSYVIDQISEDNWSRLYTFKGQSKPETFLFALTGNFLEEFSRKRFGRPRPPEWLKRQGEIWVQIWKLICLERQMVQSVIDQLTYNAIREPGFIKQIVTTIKAKIPTCGESNREINISNTNTDENEDVMPELNADHETPGDNISNAYYSEVLLLIASLFTDDISELTLRHQSIESANNYATEKAPSLNQLRDHIDLTDEERLLLKMVYQDGMKKSVIAKALGMQAHTPGRIIKRVLDSISEAMLDLGIDMNEIKTLCVK